MSWPPKGGVVDTVLKHKAEYNRINRRQKSLETRVSRLIFAEQLRWKVDDALRLYGLQAVVTLSQSCRAIHARYIRLKRGVPLTNGIDSAGKRYSAERDLALQRVVKVIEPLDGVKSISIRISDLRIELDVSKAITLSPGII